jgi:hypothetical protein
MILLRKKKDALLLGDFRPISLIHSFAKLFTKVLACRIAPHMNSLVRTNQSAFITGRLIHENFKAVQLTAKLLRRKKIPSALYKIDIAKAFDSLDWTFLLEVLKHMGFSRRWLNWISLILSTASTKIILNGSPGDPLSPFLFVLAMEALNALIKKAEAKGMLEPLGRDAGTFGRQVHSGEDFSL